jgi:hypothetical protein
LSQGDKTPLLSFRGILRRTLRRTTGGKDGARTPPVVTAVEEVRGRFGKDGKKRTQNIHKKVKKIYGKVVLKLLQFEKYVL